MAQQWNPEHYRRDGGFVAEYGREVAGLLNPQPGERILDLGCGDGRLTEFIASFDSELIAIDSSREQIIAARDRRLDARVVDAIRLPFREEFDAVFSNAALHWIKPPEDVVRGVFTALRPGGRFVCEFGGAGNIAAICDALTRALATRGFDFDELNPWYFPTADEYAELLRAVGFAVKQIELFDRPTPLATDIIAWLRTFTRVFIEAIPRAERHDFLAELRDLLRPTLLRDTGDWFVDYVRLRLMAWKPG